MQAADAIVEAALREGRVLLTGPVGPDGDSVGACLALGRHLRERGAEVVVAGDLPKRYAFLPFVDEIVPDAELQGSFGAVIVLDGDRHRLPSPVAAHFAAARVQGIVDHHGSSRPEGYTHAWLEPAAESTCGMLLRWFRARGLPVGPEVAELLYAGLVFDTGGFRHPNTSPDTLRLAAELQETGIDHGTIVVKVLSERTPAGLAVFGRILAEAQFSSVGGLGLVVARAPLSLTSALPEGDLEGLTEALLNTEGTEVAALLFERDGFVKYSLRSRGRKDPPADSVGAIDVAAIASRLHPTGGGHPRAAGASVPGDLDSAAALLLATLATSIQEGAAPLELPRRSR